MPRGYRFPVTPSTKRQVWYFQPHKKCQSPQGLLFYEAWVSKSGLKSTTLHPQDSPRTGTFGKIKDTLSKSPLLARKHVKEQPVTSPDPVSFSPNIRRRRNSRSLSDLSRLNLENNSGGNLLTINTGLTGRANSSSDITITTTDEASPEITKITPNVVSVKGGTKICLEGSNLGEDKNDIIGLSLCGANCLKSLEYFSTSKLYCTTKPWKPCIGYIGIETRLGGRARSITQLTFKEDPPEGVCTGSNRTSGGDVTLPIQNTVSPASPRRVRSWFNFLVNFGGGGSF